MVGHWEQRTTDTGIDCYVLLVKANISSSLHQLAMAFALLSSVTLLVAGFMTILGFWPVMVFAVAHLLIVGWALRLAWRNNWQVMQVILSRDRLQIMANQGGRNWKTSMTTAWTRVNYEPGRPPAVDNRVWLSCQGTRLELGRFLNYQERELLADRLRHGLQSYSLLHSGSPAAPDSTGSELIA